MHTFPERLDRGFGPLATLEHDRLLLAFKKSLTRDEIETFLDKIDLLPDRDGPGNHGLVERVNHSVDRIWVRSDRQITDVRYSEIERAGAQLLDWIGPVYRLPGAPGRTGLFSSLPNVLVIRVPDSGKKFDRKGLREVPEKSRFLGPYRYFLIHDPSKTNAYQIRKQITESGQGKDMDVRFENMPLLMPISITPNDPMYSQQWNMQRIKAGGAGTTGWDISTGDAAVKICVIDQGVDLTHPDLAPRVSNPGINLQTNAADGSPTGNPLQYHGTACAGLAVASYDNSEGMAGVAGSCSLLSAALVYWSDVEITAGLNWAATPEPQGGGADVISMSFGDSMSVWDQTLMNGGIQTAFNAGIILCAATGNDNGGPIDYPATNPLVLAVGASDMLDGCAWFSNFGPEMSVVAPGTGMTTTDLQGTPGAAAGNYNPGFMGTSAATPHVAGLAGLLRSAYPGLSNVQIRTIIEQTAERVAVSYTDIPGYPNGRWNTTMGYGRINVHRALDLADVIIRDSAGDDGTEPSTAPNFWELSDIVVRPADDGVFNPSDPLQSREVELGQDNYVYVQVTNKGPAEARDVAVSVRIMPYVGLWFVYPADWTTIDSTHIEPLPITASFTTIPAGATAMAKFLIDSAQVATLFGWETNNQWHPCMVAMATSTNDYSFDPDPLSGEAAVRRNNLAQRNLTVVDAFEEMRQVFPFIAGCRWDRESGMAVTIDRSHLPQNASILLALDEDGSFFPGVNFENTHEQTGTMVEGRIVFLDRTRIRTSFGGRIGELTLEKGSRFDPEQPPGPGKVKVTGGDVMLRDGKRYVDIRENRVAIQMQKSPGAIFPLSIQTTIPPGRDKGEMYRVRVIQHNHNGAVVGGATVIYVAR